MIQTGNVLGYISAVKLSDEMVLVGDSIAAGKSSNVVWLLTYAYKFIQKSGYKYVLNAVENSTVKKLCLRLNFIHVPKGVTNSLGFSQSCSWFIDPIIEICNQLNIEVNYKHILGSKKNGEWPHYSIKADNTMVHMDLGDILNTLDHPTQPNFQIFIEHSNCAVGEILGENVYLRCGERVYIKSPSVKLLNLYAVLSWDDGSAKLQFFDDFIYDDVESHSCGLNIICSY